MEKKQKMLYLMGIGWSWIKQRPHFIAEGLSEKYDVVTLSKKRITQRGDGNETKVNVVYPLRLIPERLALIKYINTLIYNFYIRYYLKRCKYVWFCAPNDYSEYALKKCNESHVVIYDCMDDMLAFPSKKGIRDIVFKREYELLKRANIIFCSANHLKNLLKERYQLEKEIVLLNNALTIDENGYASRIDAQSQCPLFFNSNAFKVTYIGTIADWFDFELVRQLLETIPNSEVHLFGPCTKNLQKLHQYERMFFHGPIDHKYIKAIMQGSNALIMPFILTELIQSVNPVKLYEYIYSGVPCLAPLYEESKPFRDFCYLYVDRKDCLQELKRIQNHQYTINQNEASCISFVKKNTWGKRMEVVLNYVEKY